MVKARVRKIKDFWHEKTYEGSSIIYRLTKDGGLPDVGVDYVEMEEDQKLKAHYHKSPTVLIVVLEGSGFVHLDGKEFAIKKGDVINIPPKVTHGFRTGKEKLVFLSIQAPPIYGKEAEKDTHFI